MSVNDAQKHLAQLRNKIKGLDEAIDPNKRGEILHLVNLLDQDVRTWQKESSSEHFQGYADCFIKLEPDQICETDLMDL